MPHCKIIAVLVGSLVAGSALAADPAAVKPAEPPPSPFDVTFGAKLSSDYNFRGISQSALGPSGSGYVEVKYGLFYAGASLATVDLATRPPAEIDLYAGVRPTWGPLNFDFGAIYYWYPREQQLLVLGVPFTPRNTDYIEGVAKVSYTWNDMVTIGANLFAAPNWLGTGAHGIYASATAKVTLPYDFAVSAELGHYWLGRTDAYLGGIDLADYTYWNIGLSWTHKAMTVDLRYHDTNLSKGNCFLITSDPGGIATGRSNWCGAAIIAAVSFDLTASSLFK